MDRRDFSKLAGMALPALHSAAAQAPKRIRTAMITEPGGAHLNYYFESLALAEEVGSVALCDPSGASLAMAQKGLGSKLTGSYKDLRTMFRKEKFDLALISREGVPPKMRSETAGAAEDQGRKGAEIGSSAQSPAAVVRPVPKLDRKSTRLNSSHLGISYAVFC